MLFVFVYVYDMDVGMSHKICLVNF
jgi:hypothetical protein